jgi:membrane protease YdiL (CAAX protease family)
VTPTPTPGAAATPPAEARGPEGGSAATGPPGARRSHPALRRVPRWGSVAHRHLGGLRVSTVPRTGALRTGAPRTGASRTGTAVLVGGLVFLVGRMVVAGLPFAVPLLAVGYLGLLTAALAVGGHRAGRADRRPLGDGPLGWGVPLGLGVVAVVGAGVVGGPVGDRRVGGVAVALALLAAVAEEALFRRLLYDRLLRFGAVVAVAGSAVVFAVVHLPAYGLAAMPVDLGAALLLGWQRYASGRWTVPAVTHAVANLLAVT